jgi:hypothetical protein
MKKLYIGKFIKNGAFFVFTACSETLEIIAFEVGDF